ncbi:hypothetical protein [Amycolatopsis sp. NPDC059657]|uniref:hypothetical protein n=1 Tax=Amycolatopsis sp. NPDC059657 TaxID=3346899 RepID=UPI0036731D3D
MLAGFVFTAMIILFGRSGVANSRTLGLFSAAFVVLAFDSYLFSLISGGSFDRLRQRIWAETMAASGLLAVGGIALISGIAWLLANYTQTEQASAHSVPASSETGRPVDLQTLSQRMVLGVGAGVTLLLAMTTLDYISVTLNEPAPTLIIVGAYVLPIGVVALAAILSKVRSSRFKSDGSSIIELPLPRSLSTAISSTLTYGIVGPLFAGAVTNIGDDFFNKTSWPLITLAIVIGFVIPVALIVLLVYTVPRIVTTLRTGAAECTDEDDAPTG